MRSQKFITCFNTKFIVLPFAIIILLMQSCSKPEIRKEPEPFPGGGDSITHHPDMPNIILIVAEDMGYEIPSCNGGQSYETPTLDRLTQQGMRFTQCHGAPMCAPSRWMLMTGKYNFRNYFYYGKMYTDQRTFANILSDKGYETGVYGKWALDGGDASVKTFGFKNYAIWNPFKDASTGEGRGGNGSLYISTNIYDNAAFLSPGLTKGKYSDDIFTDSVLHFIEANKSRPFFAYFPMIASHIPACPTPDDPEFATWNPALNIDDTSFFRSQVKYTDKKIGQIVDKVNELNIAGETVIIVLFGDNGTREGVTSLFNGQYVEGSRQQPTEHGTHVPLFVYWPGKIAPGTVNNDLIDFTDFLPTIADIANTSIPVTYGKIDGKSFYQRLLGGGGTPRDWIYDFYWPVPNRPGMKTFFEWVQTKEYKLYDSSCLTMKGEFYKLVNNTEQQPAMDINFLTAEEKITRQNLLNVLQMQHSEPDYRHR